MDKTIKKCALIGLLLSLASSFLYTLVGLLFKETVFDLLLYYCSYFFVWPFVFLVTPISEATGSYLGIILGLFIASSLGGLLYGLILGTAIWFLKKIFNRTNTIESEKMKI